jgi:hypothetical protein
MRLARTSVNAREAALSARYLAIQDRELWLAMSIIRVRVAMLSDVAASWGSSVGAEHAPLRVHMSGARLVRIPIVVSACRPILA